MNIIEIIVLILISCGILYFIYQHYKLKTKTNETFTSALQTQLQNKNNEIISGITAFSNIFASPNIRPDDPNLFNIYSNDLANERKSNKLITSSINSMLDTDIIKLTNDINFINNQTKHMSVPQTNYNSIKSLQNGMNLSIQHINSNQTKQSNKYLVKLNDGCLKTTPSGSYSVKPCDAADITQLFSSLPIYDSNYYNSILEKGLDLNTVASTDSYPYPFLVMKADNNGNCLQNNQGSVSIEPCGILKSQRWKGLKNPVNCVA
jgi:hypothetical protein